MTTVLPPIHSLKPRKELSGGGSPEVGAQGWWMETTKGHLSYLNMTLFQTFSPQVVGLWVRRCPFRWAGGQAASSGASSGGHPFPTLLPDISHYCSISGINTHTRTHTDSRTAKKLHFPPQTWEGGILVSGSLKLYRTLN